MRKRSEGERLRTRKGWAATVAGRGLGVGEGEDEVAALKIRRKEWQAGWQAGRLGQ